MRTEFGASAPSGEVVANISRAQFDRNSTEKTELDRIDVSELVTEAKRGNREAFGALYGIYQPRIFRLARFYLGSGAEDATSETFVRAWAGLGRYRDQGVPFVAWLYGIARHVVTDELRKGSRSEPRESLPEIATEISEDDRLVLADAISKLPKEQRRVIELKYLIGMKNPEVSAVLGKSIGAINAQQWRALQKLRKLVES